MLELPLERIHGIFHAVIEPNFSIYTSSPTPATVFLGAQPGAGKTNAQSIITEMYSEGALMPIVGDDFRSYHPDYNTLLETDPLEMPNKTARAAGIWTGMTVEWTRKNSVSCIIEGTWRNKQTVLEEAKRAKSVGRATHAVLLSVPPILSRLSILGRYYTDMEGGRRARWTPPEAHDETVRNLPYNVEEVATAGIFDRYTVITRKGVVLYDGEDPVAFVKSWKSGFDRLLSETEVENTRKYLNGIVSLWKTLDSSNTEAKKVLNELHSELKRELNLRKFLTSTMKVSDLRLRERPYS